MDILELALEDKDLDTVRFLLCADPRLIHHVLSNGRTLLQYLKSKNLTQYVINKYNKDTIIYCEHFFHSFEYSSVQPRTEG